MSPSDETRSRTWIQKFSTAFHGVGVGIRGQRSFYVHLPMALLVVVMGVLLRVDLMQWCALVLCIGIVLAAELFNSALESLAKAIDKDHNPHIADGLDMACGAVLITAIGASTVGAIIFVARMVALFGQTS